MSRLRDAKPDDSGEVWFVKDGQKSRVDSGLKLATGLAYRPDQWLLSVADGQSKWVYSYQIQADGSLTNKERFFPLHVADWDDDAGAESVCYAREGPMLVATRSGVQVCADDGPTQVILPLPDRGRVTGVCLGGRELDTLFAFSGDKIWKRKVKVHAVGAFTPWTPVEGQDSDHCGLQRLDGRVENTERGGAVTGCRVNVEASRRRTPKLAKGRGEDSHGKRPEIERARMRLRALRHPYLAFPGNSRHDESFNNKDFGRLFSLLLCSPASVVNFQDLFPWRTWSWRDQMVGNRQSLEPRLHSLAVLQTLQTVRRPHSVHRRVGSGDLEGLRADPGIYPVGRLDRDSEGFLLLTDDGPLAHRLTDPRHEHPKTYLAQVEKVPDETGLGLPSGAVFASRTARPARSKRVAHHRARPSRLDPCRSGFARTSRPPGFAWSSAKAGIARSVE